MSGFKWTALSHIVSGALHRAENLVRQVGAAGLTEGFGQDNRLSRNGRRSGENRKHVRGVSKARHHHLRLDGILQKKMIPARVPALLPAKTDAIRPSP